MLIAKQQTQGCIGCKTVYVITDLMIIWSQQKIFSLFKEELDGFAISAPSVRSQKISNIGWSSDG
jgi:hypothetical protein